MFLVIATTAVVAAACFLVYSRTSDSKDESVDISSSESRGELQTKAVRGLSFSVLAGWERFEYGETGNGVNFSPTQGSNLAYLNDSGENKVKAVIFDLYNFDEGLYAQLKPFSSDQRQQLIQNFQSDFLSSGDFEAEARSKVGGFCDKDIVIDSTSTIDVPLAGSSFQAKLSCNKIVDDENTPSLIYVVRTYTRDFDKGHWHGFVVFDEVYRENQQAFDSILDSLTYGTII